MTLCTSLRVRAPQPLSLSFLSSCSRHCCVLLSNEQTSIDKHHCQPEFVFFRNVLWIDFQPRLQRTLLCISNQCIRASARLSSQRYSISHPHTSAIPASLPCRIQVAADNAVFGQTGPKVGSFDAGYGSTQMVRLIGQKKAREMWFLARLYDAQQALDMGLVNTVRVGNNSSFFLSFPFPKGEEQPWRVNTLERLQLASTFGTSKWCWHRHCQHRLSLPRLSFKPWEWTQVSTPFAGLIQPDCEFSRAGMGLVITV